LPTVRGCEEEPGKELRADAVEVGVGTVTGLAGRARSAE